MNTPIPINTPCLLQVAKDIRDPTCSMLGQASLGQVLEQWLQAKQSLPTQLQAQVAAECRHQQNDRSSTGPLARQHKFRLATHVILAADPNLADHIARVGTPLNLAPLQACHDVIVSRLYLALCSCTDMCCSTDGLCAVDLKSFEVFEVSKEL